MGKNHDPQENNKKELGTTIQSSHLVIYQVHHVKLPVKHDNKGNKVIPGSIITSWTNTTSTIMTCCLRNVLIRSIRCDIVRFVSVLDALVLDLHK